MALDSGLAVGVPQCHLDWINASQCLVRTGHTTDDTDFTRSSVYRSDWQSEYATIANSECLDLEMFPRADAVDNLMISSGGVCNFLKRRQ